MYIFTIKTNEESYKKYDGKTCWIPKNNPIRQDGYIEVYVLEYEEYILVRPSELED